MEGKTGSSGINWFLVIILLLVIAGLWKYPNITKSMLTGFVSWGKVITGFLSSSLS